MSKSQLTPLLFLLVVRGLVCTNALAQNCAYSEMAAWNPEIRNVVAGCTAVFSSPDRRSSLRIASDGIMSIDSDQIHWRGPQLEPPAMVSWSPSSNVFFVNDGEGSGLSSSFRFFRLNRTEVFEEKSIGLAIISMFRRRMHCSAQTADPNVWGFGWGSEGGTVFLLIQPTVNNSCGRPDEFISAVVRISDGGIQETLTKRQTRVRFGPQLPSSLFSK